VGVVGCGWWSTAAHLPGIAEHPTARISAVADPSRENRDYAAQRFGVEAAFDDAERMLDAVELDAVVVATPPAAHFEPARLALERGLNVLVEKPMVLRADHARELVHLAAARNCELSVGYTWHFSPHVAHVKAAIADGALGPVEHVSSFFGSIARALYAGRPERLSEALGNPEVTPGPASYSDPGIAGGGQVQAQLTHSIALALHLTGLRIARVAAFLEAFELGVDVADAVAVVYSNGAVGAFGSTGGMVAGQEEILECRIFGHDGHALLDVTRGTASLHGRDGTVEELAALGRAERGDNLALYPEQAPVRNLIGMTRGLEPNVNPGALGLHVVEVIEAIYEAAGAGRTVLIAEPAD
jgi:predicted dehydrogenase